MGFSRKIRSRAGPATRSLTFLETTAAILLRKTRFSDTSLILTWFTEAHGKLKTVVKGALRPKSRFAGMLDLFYACEISIARSAKTELHTLREASLLDPREKLRREYLSVALAAYFIELLDLTTEFDHPAPELYNLLTRALAHLDKKAPTQRALLHFESELAASLGVQQPGVTPPMAIGRVYHRIPATRRDLISRLPEA